MAGRAKSGRGAERRADLAKRGSEREHERPRFGVCRGARPGCPLSCTGKVGSRRYPLARPASASWRANISPRSLLSRCLGRCCCFLKNFIAVEIKHPLGAIETAGRLCFCNPPGTPGWGPAAARSWRGLRAQLPPRTGCGAAESRIFMLYFKKI